MMKFKLIQAIKIWIVIYPSITVFYLVFEKQLADVPLYFRTLILTLILVPWMMFFGLPFLNMILKKIKNHENP